MRGLSFFDVASARSCEKLAMSIRHVFAFVLGASSFAACKPRVGAHPDASKVTSAQKGWCAALARFEAPKDQSWGHIAACNAATPTGSAVFVTRMTECYTKHHESEGENAIDLGGLVSRCAEEILGESDAPEATRAAPVRASCARLERCQKVAPEMCLSAVDTLAPMQKAGLTSAYNLTAQHAIATCLDETPCKDDEDAVRTECYRESLRNRVWLPPL